MRVFGTLGALFLLSAPGLVRGAEKVPPRDVIKYVRIPPGRFLMGCVPDDPACEANERPRHPVKITHEAWMMQTDVTVFAYKAFARETGRAMPKAPEFNPEWSHEDHPIVNATWHDATAYCTWAGARLPTEAEWEYAARAGKDGRRYPWGNEITAKNANYDPPQGPDDWAFTAPVACYEAAGHGDYDMTGDIFDLYDMAGNAWQWVADGYDKTYYERSPEIDPQGPPDAEQHVLRGGSWYSVPQSVRTSYRHHMKPDGVGLDFSFRCVRGK